MFQETTTQYNISGYFNYTVKYKSIFILGMEKSIHKECNESIFILGMKK
jgi:hypothetical protein